MMEELPSEREAVRDLIWVGSSRDELRSLPRDVRICFGVALMEIQRGETPPHIEPLPEIGRGVMEIKERHDGNTYRVVYIAKLSKGIYVLASFLKKSKSGRKIPKEVLGLLERRYKSALAWERGE